MGDTPGTLRWHTVCQAYPRPEVPDPCAELRRRLETGGFEVPAGAGVAIAVGSRGIPGIGALVGEVVHFLRAVGARPIVVPAMGTHGGATPPEQVRVLADLGITEAAVGAPVRWGALLEAGRTGSGLTVWCDGEAWAADRLVPINRVKPHTAFRGDVESGPSKLLAVGLGREASASTLHAAGLEKRIPEVAGFYLASGKVPFGVALVENAHGGMARVATLHPGDWLEAEGRLLAEARRLAPRLPWDDLDLLVVERIGKDVSGTGMDLHVVGMERRFAGCGATPHIRRIVALDLTEASHGNANGVGYADVVTRRLADRIDWEATYGNCRATGFLEAVRLPYVAEDDAEAISVALSGLGPLSAAGVRGVRIRDTSHLTRFAVTDGLLADLPACVRKPSG